MLFHANQPASLHAPLLASTLPDRQAGGAADENERDDTLQSVVNEWLVSDTFARLAALNHLLRTLLKRLIARYEGDSSRLMRLKSILPITFPDI